MFEFHFYSCLFNVQRSIAEQRFDLLRYKTSEKTPIDLNMLSFFQTNLGKPRKPVQ
jgi:hypothetical protein